MKKVPEQQGKDDISRGGCYPVSAHARKRLQERWPATVLRPRCFDSISVPVDAPLLGYDSSTAATHVVVPGTPMAAVVCGGVVVSFLTLESAKARIALHGYGPEDFSKD